jgi:hypothetical protein
MLLKQKLQVEAQNERYLTRNHQFTADTFTFTFPLTLVLFFAAAVGVLANSRIRGVASRVSYACGGYVRWRGGLRALGPFRQQANLN